MTYENYYRVINHVCCPFYTLVGFTFCLATSIWRLFNVPSRYLLPIGLVEIFSLGWSLPPVFRLHLQTTRLFGIAHIATFHSHLRDFHPLWNFLHISDTKLSPQGMQVDQSELLTRHRTCSYVKHGLRAGLLPFQSPLLGESLLVSFPPLIYMLKFSGFSPSK